MVHGCIRLSLPFRAFVFCLGVGGPCHWQRGSFYKFYSNCHPGVCPHDLEWRSCGRGVGQRVVLPFPLHPLFDDEFVEVTPLAPGFLWIPAPGSFSRLFFFFFRLVVLDRRFVPAAVQLRRTSPHALSGPSFPPAGLLGWRSDRD